MAVIAFVVVIIALIWWASWLIIALTKRDFLIFGFLFVIAAVWGFLEVILARAPNVGLNIVALVLLVIPIITLPFMLRIVREYDRGVLFRLGRQRLILGPGLNLIFPLGIDIVRNVDLRIVTVDVAKQEVITKDNVPVQVDAVVYFNVFDPSLAVVKVADYKKSTEYLGQTILRSVLGQHELDEILSQRADLSAVLRKNLDEATDPWGVKVSAVEIKTIELPESMKRAMAKQAEAERERRAKVIAADGEFQASEKLQAAAKVLAEEPVAIQLRYLQTLAEIAVEKNSTILFPLPMELMRFFMEKQKA